MKAFGSFVTGLSLPSSDLDLVICLPKVQREAGPEAPGALEGRNAIKETWQQHLARYLRKEDWVDVNSIKVIQNTAVPVIKFQTRPQVGEVESSMIEPVSIDVSFEGNGHQGLEANKLNLSLLNEFPALRSLVLVLKRFLSGRGLCEAFSGGLSSYAIILLCARFLQEQPLGECLDIGAMLLGILNFYGNQFQPAAYGISVLRHQYFARSTHSQYYASTNLLNDGQAMSTQEGMPPYRRHLVNNSTSNTAVSGMGIAFNTPYKFDPLFVEDPLLQGNNVGRNCFRIQQVQRVWSHGYTILMEKLAMIEAHGTLVPLLHCLFSGDAYR